MVRSAPSLSAVLLLSALASTARAASPPDPAVAASAAAFAALEKQEVERLSKVLDELLAEPAYLAAFQERNRDKLLERTKARFSKLQTSQHITHWYFLDPEPARTCFLRVHQPANFGDVVGRETFSRAIATHQVGSGKELGKTAFAIRVVKPMRAGGAVVGYMELGEETEDFVMRLKKQTGDDFAILLDKKRIDRKELARVRGEDRWDERPDLVVIDSTIMNDKQLTIPPAFDQLTDQGAAAGEGAVKDRKHADGVFPLRDAANRIVGVLYVRHQLAK
jgi:hypothetical protein